MVSAAVTPKALATPRSQLLSRLLPLNSGPGEIVALDGLRAIAALSVMMFHAHYIVSRPGAISGADVTYLWNYGQTGVHLFFVLSGFLLFTPYARAMLNGRPLPSVKRFFQRRALRILPAYWVCLAILAALQYPQLANPKGLVNIGIHLFLLHDDVFSINRTIEGPFWTLAVEAQFYVVLPLFAWLMSRFVGTTRSRWRVIASVLALIAGALVVRAADATIHGRSVIDHQGLAATLGQLFVHVTLGAQGKYLEVFGLGMLSTVVYQIAQDESRRLRRRLPLISIMLIAVALVMTIGLAQFTMRQNIVTPGYVMFYHAWDPLVIGGPLLIGIPYAALTIGVLWAPQWLRGIFEAKPLQLIGLISYSLYLWHLPILEFAAQQTMALPVSARIGIEILVGFMVAIPVAFLSYQLVERPFLSQRRRLATQPA